jgi:protease-4
MMVGLSFAVNFLILAAILAAGGIVNGPLSNDEERPLRELFHSGSKPAKDKIALVRIDGIILEGMISYFRRQLADAADDNLVKAVVVRINSPGGSITASDDLYNRIKILRDGNSNKGTQPKPIVVSMAGLAASGGYYIAMPAKHLVAERTTITGSIGVYAAFPNVAQLADDWGVKMEVIKAGEVKDSGSMFHAMTVQERRLWQDMVDNAYGQFLSVVKEGRAEKLKYDPREDIQEERKKIPDTDKDGKKVMVEYSRKLADGGIFSSDQAMQYGLIDQIGYLDDAIAVAKKLAALGDNYKVISYEKPRSLVETLFGVKAPAPEANWNWSKVAETTGARIWYLMPQSGLSGLLAAGNEN